MKRLGKEKLLACAWVYYIQLSMVYTIKVSVITVGILHG
jgi:hypothetical protein